MLPSDRAPRSGKAAPRRIVPPRPVRLRVAGSDLLLNGRFSNWVPVSVEQTDAQGGSVQVLVDVTSMAKDDRKSDAFTFESRDVRRVAPMTYSARGTLRAGRVERAIEVVLQTPASHTPFMMVTLGLPKNEFQTLWRQLYRKVPKPTKQDETELRATAWLREPEVAAA